MNQPTAHDVAAYILREQGPMSPWKLHKLLYYAQAWHLTWEGEPLFHDEIQAWAGGPVVPALYPLHRGIYRVSAWPPTLRDYLDHSNGRRFGVGCFLRSRLLGRST